MENDENREESPYQIYINMYCSECADSDCTICKDLKLLNKHINELKKIGDPSVDSEYFIDNIFINNEVRDIVYKCAKLRQMFEKKYK